MNARGTRGWLLRRLLAIAGVPWRAALSAPSRPQDRPGGTDERWVDVGPLRRLVELYGGPQLAAAELGVGADYVGRLGALCKAYHRAAAGGRLTVFAADELAVRLLGRHPAFVWGDAWWEANA